MNHQLERRNDMAEKGPVKKKNKPRRFYDYSLLFTVIFLSVFGLVMIYSASSYAAQLKFNNAAYFMMRQAKIALAGFIIMIVISKLDTLSSLCLLTLFLMF